MDTASSFNITDENEDVKYDFSINDDVACRSVIQTQKQKNSNLLSVKFSTQNKCAVFLSYLWRALPLAELRSYFKAAPFFYPSMTSNSIITANPKTIPMVEK